MTRSSRDHTDSTLGPVYTLVPEKMYEGPDEGLLRPPSGPVPQINQEYCHHSEICQERCYKIFYKGAFIQEVKDMNFKNVYMGKDASLAAEILTRNLNFVLDIMAPVKTIQVRHSQVYMDINGLLRPSHHGSR